MRCGLGEGKHAPAQADGCQSLPIEPVRYPKFERHHDVSHYRWTLSDAFETWDM